MTEAKTTYNAPSAAQAKKPSTALPPGMRKGVLGKNERYAPRVRQPGEALPPTYIRRGTTYVPGDGDVKHAYRAGAFDHLKYKSLGIGV